MVKGTAEVIIADDQRLGRRVLSKIIEPYLTQLSCDTPKALDQAITGNNSCRFILISHQWPDIESTLENLSTHTNSSIFLLASSESDPERLALLTEKYNCQLLLRPYQPAQVIRQLIAHPPTLSADKPDESLPVLTERDTSSTTAESILRDMAFCRRHQLPYSIMALRIHDLPALCQEVGEAVCVHASTALEERLHARLRYEDGLHHQENGWTLVSLPGTSVLGARVLAHRICSWLKDAEFEVDDCNLHLTTQIGIHTPNQEDDADAIIENVIEAAEGAHANEECSAVHLSPTANENAMELAHAQRATTYEAHSTVPSEEETTLMWQQFTSLLTNQDENRQQLLSQIIYQLTYLSEAERMGLIEELLLAPTTAQ